MVGSPFEKGSLFAGVGIFWVAGREGIQATAKGPRKNKFTFLREPACSSNPAESCDG